VIIQITPVGKPRMTQRDKWKQRPAVLRYHSFCDEIRLKYKQPLPAALLLTFYIAMPESWSARKKEAMVGEPHQQRPDTDNFCKAVMDALAWDDSYIYILGASKWWALEGGIEIGVLRIGKRGSDIITL